MCIHKNNNTDKTLRSYCRQVLSAAPGVTPGLKQFFTDYQNMSAVGLFVQRHCEYLIRNIIDGYQWTNLKKQLLKCSCATAFTYCGSPL